MFVSWHFAVKYSFHFINKGYRYAEVWGLLERQHKYILPSTYRFPNKECFNGYLRW